MHVYQAQIDTRQPAAQWQGVQAGLWSIKLTRDAALCRLDRSDPCISWTLALFAELIPWQHSLGLYSLRALCCPPAKFTWLNVGIITGLLCKQGRSEQCTWWFSFSSGRSDEQHTKSTSFFVSVKMLQGELLRYRQLCGSHPTSGERNPPFGEEWIHGEQRRLSASKGLWRSWEPRQQQSLLRKASGHVWSAQNMRDPETYQESCINLCNLQGHLA